MLNQLDKQNIPLVDLQRQYHSIKDEIDCSIHQVLHNVQFIQGKFVAKFEREFSSFIQGESNTKIFCASCANGTDALYLALRALGITRGDEVITVAHTFAATVESILQLDAIPVLVDIKEDTMLMDAEKIEEKITPKTKAIIPVHLYGQTCDMQRIMNIAKKHNIFVIEDAAQAHGASLNGINAGAWGDVACFSFYPGKNLGAYGDGGAVVSKNNELIDKIKMIANHGRKEKYEHQILGINSRLDELQAAVLSVKLKYLKHWNILRNRNVEYYKSRLSGSDFIFQSIVDSSFSVWHLLVLRHPQRDEIMTKLTKNGISSGIHYPIPLHRQKAFESLVSADNLPVTEKICREIFSLPLFPELKHEEIDRIVSLLWSKI